jgi:tetratricopeptide (TPR) repeat protein/TolB-like protein
MRKLLDRRVPQIAGAYLAASWVFLEFTDWAVDQWALSPALTNFVVTTLLLLLPMVVVLAWRHGAPGQDSWTKTDGAVIGLNLVAAAGILAMAFSGQELGAATTVRLLEDDDGNTVERVIPKAAFRRDVLVWDFDNESGDPDLDWLRSGLWMGVWQDLSQDLFVTPVEATDPRVRGRLDQAGFELPYGIPLALKREIAEARGVGHFLEGEVLDRVGDTLVVRTRLYETRNAREVAARTYRGTDPLEMVDRMSVDVRRDLGIPEWQIEESVDLPAAEMLTDSPEAFRALSGNRVSMYRNQLAEARAAADAAIEIDPAFASAHVASAGAALLLGDQAAARDGIAEALRHAYRLPERSRLFLQMLDRMLFRMDPAGALQTGGYWTELYPQDPLARELLAVAYGIQGDVDGQIGQYRALIVMDSTDVESLRAIADVFQGKQDYDSALVYYARLAEMQPADVQTRVDIAATRISLLEFDEARDELERARIAAPDDPEVLSRLAGLDLRQGRHDDAARRLEQMSTLARTPQQRALVAGFEETYFYNLGQYGALLEAHGRRLAAIGEFLPPISAVLTINDSEALTFAGDWGREADALAEIDSLRAGVEEPWSLAPDVAAVQVHLDRGDIESAAESLAGLRALSESFGEARMFARIAWVEGRIAELEDGDCRRALQSYEAAGELLPQSPVYRAWLAICLTSLERWEEAEAEAAWLLERIPGSAMVRLIAARHYSARGRTADAIAELEIALGYWSTADADYRPAREAQALLDELQLVPSKQPSSP